LWQFSTRRRQIENLDETHCPKFVKTHAPRVAGGDKLDMSEVQIKPVAEILRFGEDYAAGPMGAQSEWRRQARMREFLLTLWYLRAERSRGRPGIDALARGSIFVATERHWGPQVEQLLREALDRVPSNAPWKPPPADPRAPLPAAVVERLVDLEARYPRILDFSKRPTAPAAAAAPAGCAQHSLEHRRLDTPAQCGGCPRWCERGFDVLSCARCGQVLCLVCGGSARRAGAAAQRFGPVLRRDRCDAGHELSTSGLRQLSAAECAACRVVMARGWCVAVCSMCPAPVPRFCLNCVTHALGARIRGPP
jgi:hypothetical protein